MIKITNGHRAIRVTQGAYESYFKHLGYRPVGVPETPENPDKENAHGDPEMPVPEDSNESSVGEGDSGDPDEENPEEEASEDEYEYEEDLSEIPLGEMKLSQLIAYAEQLGLDHDGSPTKKEMRTLIRNHLNQQ